ncbi:MAG: hypothetical protein GVY19_02485 [Bacteroidetes bacterium]|jgi:exonuclease I|nr:hypothetical protein [Bacteroidota bacterium]
MEGFRIIDTSLIESQYRKDQDLLTINWKPAYKNVQQVDIEEEILNLKSDFQDKRIQHLLVIYKNTNYFLNPEQPNWLENSLLKPFMQLNIQKMAVVLPHNIFGQARAEAGKLSILKPQLDFMLFNNEENAKKWLLKKYP